MPTGFFGADFLGLENLNVTTGILTLDNFEFQSNFSMYRISLISTREH